MLEKLFNKILKNRGISQASEDAGKDNAILDICRQYMILLVTVKLRHLDWCYAKWRPTCPSKGYPFITSGLININKVI